LSLIGFSSYPLLLLLFFLSFPFFYILLCFPSFFFFFYILNDLIFNQSIPFLICITPLLQSPRFAGYLNPGLPSDPSEDSSNDLFNLMLQASSNYTVDNSLNNEKSIVFTIIAGLPAIMPGIVYSLITQDKPRNFINLIETGIHEINLVLNPVSPIEPIEPLIDPDEMFIYPVSGGSILMK
jgi:hypothetical protein